MEVSEIARDLSPEVRSAIESILGERLGPGDKVTVRAESLVDAGKALVSSMHNLADKAKHVPTAELEQALDEICEEVRYGRLSEDPPRHEHPG